VEAFESDEFVLLLNFAPDILDLTFLSLKSQKVLGWANFVSISCSESLKERVWLKGTVEVLNINALEISGSQNFHEERFDLSLLVLRNLLGVGVIEALSNFHNDLISTLGLRKVSQMVLFNLKGFFLLLLILICLRFLLLKMSSKSSIGKESKADENEEVNECEPCLLHGDLLFAGNGEAGVQPDVGK
jgi:hypothetical protein